MTKYKLQIVRQNTNPTVTSERQKVGGIIKELNQVFIELTKCVIIKFVGSDEALFNKMQLTDTLRCFQQCVLRNKWSGTTIHGILLTLRQFFYFLESRRITHEGKTSGDFVTLSPPLDKGEKSDKEETHTRGGTTTNRG